MKPHGKGGGGCVADESPGGGFGMSSSGRAGGVAFGDDLCDGGVKTN